MEFVQKKEFATSSIVKRFVFTTKMKDEFTSAINALVDPQVAQVNAD
eukprot:gene20717-15238_t